MQQSLYWDEEKEDIVENEFDEPNDSFCIFYDFDKHECKFRLLVDKLLKN